MLDFVIMNFINSRSRNYEFHNSGFRKYNVISIVNFIIVNFVILNFEIKE